MRSVADYAQLMALRAPWPTLLIYNAMDDCCFRASVVKQGVYTDIKPFFALMGSPQNLQWYENGNPGTHNYQIDSREQSYRFFDRAFQLQASDKEDADTDTEVQSAADLAVGIPANNLTIVSLARQLGQAIHHEPPAHADELYSSIEARHAVASLGDLFTHPVDYHEAQEMMCLDLYRYLDFNTLRLIAAPVNIDLAGKDAEPIFW